MHINSHDIGLDGELVAFRRIARSLIEKGDWFYAFYNIEIWYRNRQIDMLFVSGSGIFVIEVKNYRGDIRGDLKDKYILHNGFQTQNPYFQNKYHIEALSSITNIAENFFENVVIFADQYDRLEITNSDKKAFSLAGYIDYLKSISKEKVSKEFGNKIANVLEEKGIRYLCTERGPSKQYASLLKSN